MIVESTPKHPKKLQQLQRLYSSWLKNLELVNCCSIRTTPKIFLDRKHDYNYVSFKSVNNITKAKKLNHR